MLQANYFINAVDISWNKIRKKRYYRFGIPLLAKLVKEFRIDGYELLASK